MPIVPAPIVSGFEMKFGYFENRFPDEAARHDAVSQLAAGDSVEVSYQSQLQVAAPWAGEDDTLRREVARTMYGHGHATEKFKGQPVLVLEHGSAEDILSDRRYLEHEIGGYIGVIPMSTEIRGIFHGFGGRLTGHGKPGGPIPPYLIAQASIQVEDDSAFMFEGDEFALAFKPLPRPQEELPFMIPVYKAEIPLEEEAYRKAFSATDHVVIYGLKKIKEISDALVRKGGVSILEPIQDKIHKPKTKAEKKAARKAAVAAATVTDTQSAQPTEKPATPKKDRLLPAALRES